MTGQLAFNLNDSRLPGDAPGAPCHDCPQHTLPDTGLPGTCEYYMVHADVWAAAGMRPESGSGYLCIGCLEQRIGRELDHRDFTDAPVNTASLIDSPRLLARKAGLTLTRTVWDYLARA